MASSINILPQFPIKTHHIKSLHTPIPQTYFLSSQPAMFLLEKSLCEQLNPYQKLNSSIQLSNQQEKHKNTKPSSRDYESNTVVSQEDVNKLLTQIIQKGKKFDSLFKTYATSSSLILTKQEFQNYTLENIYLKSTSQLLLNEYFKKRKLGPKLRGMNSDLLNQIQNKLFNLIQTQFRIWVAKKQAIKIESEFNLKAEQIHQNLQKIGLETNIL